MSVQSYTFIPPSQGGAPAPAAPAQPAPAQPQGSDVAPIPGSGALRFRMNQTNVAPGQDIPEAAPMYDGTVPIDPNNPNGPRMRIPDAAPSHQSYNTANAPQATSFITASGAPADPHTATHVRLPNGDMTSVKAAEHLGLVVRGPNGWQSTGAVFRGGEIYHGAQAQAILAQERQQQIAQHGMNSLQQARDFVGHKQFDAEMAAYRAAQGEQSTVPGMVGADGHTPASRLLAQGNAELAAQQAAAQAQAEQQRANDPSAQIPDYVDSRVPQLAAREAALVEGLSPGEVDVLKANLAASLASGDERSLKTAMQAFQMGTGVTATRAQEVVTAIGNSIGAPVKALAAKAGVQPQQLWAAMQQYDAEGFGTAIAQVARSKNASALTKLAVRTIAAARRGR